MRHLIVLAFCLFSICQFSTAQEPLKISQWRSHLPYQFGRYITQSPTKIYYTTDWAVLAMDKEDASVSFISKVEDLSNAGTAFVKYDNQSQKLVVSYTNSVFDVIGEDGTVTFANIKNDGNFFNREINDINLLQNGRMYFVTAFGIVEFDPAREEFGFTATLDINVTGIALLDDHFYAATEEGIYKAPNDPNINLKDLKNWNLLGGGDGFPDFYESKAIVNHNGLLYFNIDNTIYKYDGNQLDSLYFLTGHEIEFLTAEKDLLLAGIYCSASCKGKVISLSSNGYFTNSGSSCVDRPIYAIEDEQGQIWYADRWRDIRMATSFDEDCTKMTFNSPYTHEATDIVIQNDVVYVATEPTTIPIKFSPSGFYKLEEGQWTIFNRRTVPEFVPDNMIGFYRLAVHPDNGTIYAGTTWKGLTAINGTEASVLTGPLGSPVGDPNRIRVLGLDFDANNNLWVANNGAPNPIAVLLADGKTWKNDFRIPANLNLRNTLVDDFGNKWFTVDGKTGNSLMIFNEFDIDNPDDDRYRFLTSANSSLPSNQANCLAKDKDGDIWVGTSEGAVVFECGSNALEDNCQGSRRIVEVDGFNAYLLEDESVLTIAVDGANRKWFGSESGVFVQSANGENQVAFFNKDNSPLFDNVVFDIAINNNNGEVFIGTGKGLISLRTDATDGTPINSSDIYAFPNPVKSDYEGPIAIKGLARDANVKITDVSGQLVYETKALGGQAIWDGRDYNGRKANSGVYLVFSTSTQNREVPDAVVTKILLLH